MEKYLLYLMQAAFWGGNQGKAQVSWPSIYFTSNTGINVFCFKGTINILYSKGKKIVFFLKKQ